MTVALSVSNFLSSAFNSGFKLVHRLGILVNWVRACGKVIVTCRKFTFLHGGEVFQEPQELASVGAQYAADLSWLLLVSDEQLHIYRQRRHFSLLKNKSLQ
jgi:hypothetical protein